MPACIEFCPSHTDMGRAMRSMSISFLCAVLCVFFIVYLGYYGSYIAICGMMELECDASRLGEGIPMKSITMHVAHGRSLTLSPQRGGPAALS